MSSNERHSDRCQPVMTFPAAGRMKTCRAGLNGRAPDRKPTQWLMLACLLGAVCLPGLAAASDTVENAPKEVCHRDADQTPPSTVEQWLIRSMQASHCYAFQARAVSIDAIGVRTLALSHQIQEGVRQQVVQHLDGPSVSVERRSQIGQQVWLSGREGAAATPGGWADHVADYYAISEQGHERVAGRNAIKLQFAPNDSQRYLHTWWVDEETGLLLKHVLSDSQEQVLETFQMTQLQSPEPYEGQVVSVTPPEIAEFGWQPAWLPEGFVAQPVEPHPGTEQQLFSDGLATVSLFMSPAADEHLHRGVHQIGVSAVAVDFIEREGERWQVVGIGELPPASLRRIVQSVSMTEASGDAASQ